MFSYLQRPCYCQFLLYKIEAAILWLENTTLYCPFNRVCKGFNIHFQILIKYIASLDIKKSYVAKHSIIIKFEISIRCGLFSCTEVPKGRIVYDKHYNCTLISHLVFLFINMLYIDLRYQYIYTCASVIFISGIAWCIREEINLLHT